MPAQLNPDFLFILFGGTALLVAALYGLREAARAKRRAHQLEVEMASIESYQDQITQLKEDLEAAVSARIEAEKQVSVAEEKVSAANQRMKDWEAQREEMLQASRASVMKAGADMSTKLLEDHKREAEQAKKQAEELAKKTTAELMKNFQGLTESVAKIQDRTKENAKQVDVVMRALTNPAGAGQMAEAGLANSLKAMGLEEGRDYILQFHIAGESQNLRPDVVVFLPQDLVMVIDSKASKFAMELAEAEGSEHEEATLQKLVKTTHAHIDALARKQYSEAVAKSLKADGRALGRMLNVMYVPSDAMLEKLRAADRSLFEKADRADIVLAGPASLVGLFSLARQQIAAAKQEENQQKIIALVGDVMDNFTTALGHVEGIGKGVQSTADKLDKFAKSLNGRLLPKLRQLEALGVAPSKNKSLPQAIATYDVRRSDDVVTIEAEEDTMLAIEEKQSA